MRKLIVMVAVVGLVAGCSDSGGSETNASPGGPGVEQRAENILKAAGYWKAYGITGFEEFGGSGLYVYTSLDPGDELAATDICNQLRGLNDLVMVRVYDQGGEEIDSERCGNVT